MSRTAFWLRTVFRLGHDEGVQPSPPASTLPAPVRERRRAELLALVKEVASRHLAAEGAAALSLRAVARDVGIAVSALYRYYDNRDDLITELLIDAFHAQADAVDRAVTLAEENDPDHPAAALRAAFTAYRQWSRDHPAEFGLCYGTPVPRYAAPAERTIQPATRIPDRMMQLYGNAYAGGAVEASAGPSRESTLTPATAAQLSVLTARRNYTLSLPLAALAIDAYVQIHGFTAMDVFGQLRPITPDTDSLFAETLQTTLTRLGLPDHDADPTDPQP